MNGGGNMKGTNKMVVLIKGDSDNVGDRRSRRCMIEFIGCEVEGREMSERERELANCSSYKKRGTFI